jgi:hypothetical protein
VGEREKHFAQQLDWSAFPNREYVSDFTEAGLLKTLSVWAGKVTPKPTPVNEFARFLLGEHAAQRGNSQLTRGAAVFAVEWGRDFQFVIGHFSLDRNGLE